MAPKGGDGHGEAIQGASTAIPNRPLLPGRGRARASARDLRKFALKRQTSMAGLLSTQLQCILTRIPSALRLLPGCFAFCAFDPTQSTRGQRQLGDSKLQTGPAFKSYHPGQRETRFSWVSQNSSRRANLAMVKALSQSRISTSAPVISVSLAALGVHETNQQTSGLNGFVLLTAYCLRHPRTLSAMHFLELAAGSRRTLTIKCRGNIFAATARAQ